MDIVLYWMIAFFYPSYSFYHRILSLKFLRTSESGLRCLVHGGSMLRFPIATVIGLAVILTACASSKPEEDFVMAIGENNLNLKLSREMVIGLLEDGLDTSFDCNSEPDSEIRALLEPLEHRRYATTVIGEKEDQVIAKRRGSNIEFTIGDRKADHLKARMSWGVAQCLLGRDITLEQALGSQGISVKLTTENGKVLQATLR
jgi:hypothetical protein